MPEWICPDCQGGFPQPVKAHGVPSCPWCKAEIRGYEKAEKVGQESSYIQETMGEKL